MKRKGIGALLLVMFIGFICFFIQKKTEKSTYVAIEMEPIKHRKRNIYEKYGKRVIDFIISIIAIILLSPVYLVIAILVKLKLGSPIIFSQERPGLIDDSGRETIFKMYKFRTMTDEKDANGCLLPDEKRLTSFGAWLRSTSLDELPELFNILNGTMSIIGPRPQLVRDMVFMNKEVRMRHTAKPGLSGLAQVNGRNSISWEEKFIWDENYLKNISFIEDIRIIYKTLSKAFIKREGITDEKSVTALDYGDTLLKEKIINKEYYDDKQVLAKNILERKVCNREKGLVSIIMPSFNTGNYIMNSIRSVVNQTYSHWELLIIDDCSTDNTNDILSQINDPRIKVLKNKKNIGAALSRNWGLREARGQWIAFLDSDDLWDKEKLEKQISFMEKNNYNFSYTCYRECDSFGKLNGVSVRGPKRITKNGMFNYCWPGCLTVMYNAEKIGVIQIKDIKKNNDYAMWLKICKSADCYLLDEYLAIYRRGRKGSISSKSAINLLKWHYLLFRICEEKSCVYSFVLMIRNIIFGIIKKYKYTRRI